MKATNPTATNLAPGFWLDRYELLAPIAEGGFGQVWLARLHGKRGFEKLVAIKVPRLTGDVYFQEMLLDEARIASAIDHENVVRILELGEQGELLYIVMEWIDGEPLSLLLRTLEKKKLPFPLGAALRIVSDTCAGTHAAHELRSADGHLLGVVHRDISPQNILVTGTGKVKLIDFGIVKARDRATGETTDGTLKGKLKFMAPEQVFGKEVDRRADVFALGAVLFRLLAGYAPYEGDNEVATLQRLTSGAVATLPPHVPAVVRAVVEKALQRAPEDRFATALEMEQALLGAMASLRMPADQSNLSTLVEEHLYERMATRRQATEIALKAAADRSAIQRIRNPAGAEGSGGSGSARLEPGSIPSRSMPSQSVGAMLTGSDVAPSMPPPYSPRVRWALWGISFTLGLVGASLIFFALRARAAAARDDMAEAPMPTITSVAPSLAASTLPPAAETPATAAAVIELEDTTPAADAGLHAPTRPRPAFTGIPTGASAATPSGRKGTPTPPAAAPTTKGPSNSPSTAPTTDFGY